MKKLYFSLEKHRLVSPRSFRLLFMVLMVFFCNAIFAQIPVPDNIPGNNKNFTVPANVTSVTASVWGGGGGGGGSSANNNGGNGGGGGGADSRVFSVVANNTFTYTVGGGGAAGAAGIITPSAGGNGANSSITFNPTATIFTATGGIGGRTNANATISAGGTPSGLPGAQGGANGGKGGNSGTVVGIFGVGGNGGFNSAGILGGIPGGGGGGGEAGGGNRAGGAGANGQVFFNYISVSGISGVSPGSACLGGPITITGTNFSTTSSTTVTIGGVACTGVTVTSTTITAVVGVGTPTGSQVVVVNNGNGTNNGQSVTINSVPSAAGDISGTATVCQGQTGVSYSVDAIANSSSYTWSYSGTGATISGTTRTPTISFSATATSGILTVAGTNTCGNGIVSVNYPITVNLLPVAAGTITGSTPVCQGYNGVSYSVPTIANATDYNWVLPAGATIASGANTNSITVNFASNAVSGTITVQGSNSCGSGAIASLPISVSQVPIVISTQPEVTQTVCATGSVSFTVAVSGENLTYQWYKGATLLSGATNATLTINSLVTTDSAPDYHCVIANNCTSINSSNAALIVNEMPVIPNQTVSVCSDDIFTLTPTNGVPTIATIVPSNTTYTWSLPAVTGGMTGGVSGSGSSITGKLVNTTTNDQTATYTVTPTSGTTGSCVGNNFTVVVTVKPSPSISNITSTICSGEVLTISPVGNAVDIVPPGTTYSWTAPSVPGGEITGATSASGQASFVQTLVNTTNSDKVISYAVTATYGGCTDNTFSINITVKPKPTSAGSVPTQRICTGSAIAPITITNPNAVPGPVTYSWTRDNTTDVTGIPNGTGNTITGNLTNGTGSPTTVTFSLYATSKGCTSLASTVTVLVDPAPTVAATPSAQQTICSDGPITAINITNPNGVNGTTFTWSRDNTNITGLENGTSATIAGSLTNTTNVPQTTVFTIGTVNNSCTSPTTTVSVIVNPKPTVAVSIASQTVCGGLPFTNINITNPNGVAGTTFSWTRDNITNLTGVANNDTGGTIAGTFVNKTNTPQTATFTITATAGTCSSTTTATITVNPAPLLVITPVGPISICSGGTIPSLAFTNTNNMTGVTYSWTRDKTTEVTSVNFPSSIGSGNIANIDLTNTTAVAQTVTFTVTATAPNGCATTKTVSVTVYVPVVAPTISSNQTACAFSTPTLLTSTAPTGGSGVYTYQWQSSSTDSGPWTNISGATNSTYQPPGIILGDSNKYYQLIAFNSCGNTTSNVILIQVVNNVGFTFNSSGFPTGALCPGTVITPSISAIHSDDSAVRYTWTANSSYVTPATGGPIGTTGDRFRIIVYLRTSSADFSYTVQNNTNATVTTPISITPNVYDFPGPPTGAFLCSITAQVRNITILPTPVAIPTVANTTICNGSSANIVVKGNITDAPTTFAWSRNVNTNVNSSQASGTATAIVAGGSYTIPDVLTNISTSSQNVTYTITPSSNGCTGASVFVTITIAPPLTPGTVGTNQTICTGGDPAAFTETVAAIGSGVSYQWQSSTGSATGPWANITSATASTYDAPSGLTQTTWYQRVVTSTLNGVTCAVANAVPIQVTINTITPGSVTGDQTVCSGGDPTAFGSVAATGGGVITYQWQSNTTGCAGTWSDIGGATGATYDAPSGLTVTTYYRRIAISTLNGRVCSDFSNCITVLANNVTAGTVSGDQATCSTTATPFTESVAATGSGVLTYQWQSNTTGCSGAWADISGATATTYAPSGVSITTYYHRITISTYNGVSCTAISNCITLTVNSVTAGAIASNRTVCNGGDPTAFTEASPATGTALTYQWQMSTNSGLGPWTSISSATNPTYDAPALTQTTFYQRIAYSTIGGLTCSAASNSVTVFVNDVTAPVIAGSQSVCDVADPIAFTVTTAATAAGTLTYQWQSSTTDCSGPWNVISGATSSTYDPGPITQTTYYQVVVTSTMNAVQCTAISNCLVVTYNPNLTASVLISTPTNSTCETISTTFTATATNGGVSPVYQWKLNGGNVGNNSDSYTTTTLNNGDVITCVMTSNASPCLVGSPATSNAITMTVNAKPAAPVLNNVTLTCGETNASETWASVPNITNYLFDVSLDSFGSYVGVYHDLSIPSSDTSLILSTLNAGTTYYVRARAQNSCGPSTYSNIVTITVKASPAAPTATATSQPTCAVSTGTISVTAPTGMNYSIDGIDYTNTTGIFNNVPIGSYQVTAQNGSGCVSVVTPVTINNPVITTWNGSTWSNGTPDATKTAIFTGDASITTMINACSCQVNTGVNVVVGVPGGLNDTAILKVENEINVLGTLTFENNASLVQVNDVNLNTGKITYKRNTSPMKNYDFTYWSSPVLDQVMNILSPNTLIDKYYSWANGNWVYESGGNKMNPAGKGFLIRVPKPDVTYPNGEYWTGSTYVQHVQFFGIPFNGAITIPTQPDGGYNLIGNPYPSPLDADSFIDANAAIITGGLRFWTHNSTTTKSGDFYIYNSNDYATYNKTGGTAATTGGLPPSGKIAAGQSFFVVASAGQSFTFNNAMRIAGHILDPDSNSQFFRMSNAKQATTEKNRIWLNFGNSEGAFKQLLLGYVTGATNEMDRLYDASIFGGNDYVDFYSINKGNNLTIQGRALPFEAADKIPLGYKTTIKGTFTITIDKVDGVLANQDVFLEDKIKGTITDLKKGPYSFSSEIGNFNDRFVLRFTNTNVTTNPLGTVEVDDTKNPTLVAVKSKQIKVSSFDETIDKVKIYDLKTSLIYEKENVNSNELLISDLNSSDQFLILKILLKNGKWVTKKILF